MFLAVLGLFRKLVKSGNRKKIVIHAHTIYPDGFCAMLLRDFLPVKTVVTIHGSDINVYPEESRLIKILTRTALNRNDGIITVSDKLKNKVSRLAAPNRLVTITNGVDPDKFKINKEDKSSCTEIIRESERKVKVLYVGRFNERKGIKEMLEAILQLSRRTRNFVLFMIGHGPLANYIKDFIAENGLEEFIQVIGEVEHDIIKFWFDSSDIFLLPSYTEGMPTVMFEAGINKNAVIITAVGGVPEVINNNYNGILISPGNIAEITDSLLDLIINRTKIEELAGNLYRDIEANYTWEVNAHKTYRVYEEIFRKI